MAMNMPRGDDSQWGEGRGQAAITWYQKKATGLCARRGQGGMRCDMCVLRDLDQTKPMTIFDKIAIVFSIPSVGCFD